MEKQKDPEANTKEPFKVAELCSGEKKIAQAAVVCITLFFRRSGRSNKCTDISPPDCLVCPLPTAYPTL
jgi:hypothetical protein